MRRTDARSAQIGRPDGVPRIFQVSVYKVEPFEPRCAGNLLSKDSWRIVLANEMRPRWPQMPLISKPASFACRAERLARAGTGPDGAVVRPAGETEGIGPDTDAGEEVALSKSSKFIWYDITDVPFIDLAWRNVAGLDQLAQPSRSEWINLVVVGALPHPEGDTGHAHHASGFLSMLRMM
jgi:hypothetical protein